MLYTIEGTGNALLLLSLACVWALSVFLFRYHGRNDAFKVVRSGVISGLEDIVVILNTQKDVYTPPQETTPLQIPHINTTHPRSPIQNKNIYNPAPTPSHKPIQMTNSPPPIPRIQRQKVLTIKAVHTRPMRPLLARDHPPTARAAPGPATIHTRDDLHLATVQLRGARPLVGHEARHQPTTNVGHLRRTRRLACAGSPVDARALAPRVPVVARDDAADGEAGRAELCFFEDGAVLRVSSRLPHPRSWRQGGKQTT